MGKPGMYEVFRCTAFVESHGCSLPPVPFVVVFGFIRDASFQECQQNGTEKFVCYCVYHMYVVRTQCTWVPTCTVNVLLLSWYMYLPGCSVFCLLFVALTSMTMHVCTTTNFIIHCCSILPNTPIQSDLLDVCCLHLVLQRHRRRSKSNTYGKRASILQNIPPPNVA